MYNSQQSKPQCSGYPPAVEAPPIPYHRNPDSNPVLRGIYLIIGAWLISKLEFLQRFLWGNAGFNSLRTLAYLQNYPERWDPTVSVPLLKDQSDSIKTDLLKTSHLDEYIHGYSYTISEYHAFYTSGRITPLDVAEYILTLIRHDVVPASRHASAFISSNPEAILSAARDSTLRYKSKSPLSIFDGVPTAIKDEYHVAGYRTTTGRRSDSLPFQIANESSWPVRKLEEAGAIILGKLNMHELGADTTNNNPNYGTPLNPYNNLYYTGGSSGGAGYAVSAGLLPFALGTDGGGSIRLPASFCGVYGLKPSHGRLGDTGSTVTVMGPIASTISDLEVVYHYLTGPENPTHLNFTSSLSISKPKLIGICKAWFDRADPVVQRLCSAAVKHFETNLGYEVVDITLPCLSHGQTAHAMTILSEMSLRARCVNKSSDWLRGLNAANKILLTVGAQTSLRDYSLAQQLRNMLMQHLSFLYLKYPGLLIVTPTCPMAGWPIDQRVDLKYGISDGSKSMRCIEYAWLANFCGNPAISCPVGYAEPIKGHGRIPVGIMAMGEWGSEEQLLRWGRECENYLHNEAGGRIRPKNWTDVVGAAQYAGLAMGNIEKF
ncbi:hypothetical protein K3495_g5907 [Podosphaera aphanis]|nr:hypothetical protein K3495_g5907 [Podosphaera aphanis]